MTKKMDKEMPWVAGIIKELRDVFGVEEINTAIRAGIQGQPTFYASENGHEIGTRAPHAPEKTICVSDIHIGPFNATAAHAASRTKGK